MNNDKTTAKTDTTKKPGVEQGEVESGTSSTPVIKQLEQERKRANPGTVPIDPRDPKQSP